MVLESKWADAPDASDKTSVAEENSTKKKSNNKKGNGTSPIKNKSSSSNKRTPRKKPTNPPTSSRNPPHLNVNAVKHSTENTKNTPAPPNRLVFSVKDSKKDDGKVSNKTGEKKLDILKQKIEEQRKILHTTQHKKQQSDLLQDFLNGDEKFQWGEEDEENEIIEKLNKSLRV